MNTYKVEYLWIYIHLFLFNFFFSAGFFKTMWWTVIVAAFLLLIMVIIVVCLVVKRPKPSGRYMYQLHSVIPLSEWTVVFYVNKTENLFADIYLLILIVCFRYGLEADASLSNKYNRRNSGASKISYRTGDVYYKDKDGKMRPGTAHSSSSQENGRSHPPHFVDDEEDDNEKFEPSGTMRAKTPFELAVEKNSRNGNVYEQRTEFQLSELPSNGANGGVPSSVEN